MSSEDYQKMKMSINLLKVIGVAAVLSILFSCNSSGKIEFTKEPEVRANPNTAVPLSAYIDFNTVEEFDKVAFLLSESERSSKLEYVLSEKTDLGYLLTFMRSDQEHAIRMVITDKQGRAHQIADTLVFRTPPLPGDDKEFPKIQITKAFASNGKEELTLFNPRRRVPLSVPGANEFNKSFGMLVIVNQEGEVLWYYRTNSRISDFDMVPNGNISYMTQDSKVVEIDFAGNIVGEWYAAKRPEGKDQHATSVDAFTLHHDVSLLPNGNRLALSSEVREFDDYYTSELDKNAPRKKQKVMGDVIVEFTPRGEVVHKWHVFDHLPVERIGYETFSGYWGRRGFPGVIDWSHANAVVPLPNEDAYLINFRYQSAMIKVNKTSNEIEWIFAEPSGWGEALQDKLLAIPKDGWNWHQHSPRFMSNGNLLFFNNNNYQARPFEPTQEITKSPSYVVEYAIDEVEKTAKRVWTSEIAGEKPLVSVAMGRVSELPETGNILVCFGALVSQDHYDEMTWLNRGRFPQWTMVREYTHTTPAEIAWEMRILPLTDESPIGWTLFGAERIER